MALKRGIDQATASAVEDLKKLAKPVKGGRAKVVVDKNHFIVLVAYILLTMIQFFYPPRAA